MARTTVVMNLRRMAWVTARTAGVLVRMRIGYHEQTQLEGRSGMVKPDGSQVSYVQVTTENKLEGKAKEEGFFEKIYQFIRDLFK